MKVILLTDVKSLGKKDEIKEVKDGYAKFLINERKAVQYTNKSVEILDKEIATRKQEEDALVKECTEIKNKVEKLNLKFKVKTGAGDKVFGSVSTKEIASKLKEKGFDIDKKKIVTDFEINTLGFHEVKINLHKKVIAKVRVELVKE